MAVNDKRSFDTDGNPVIVDAEPEEPPALALLDAPDPEPEAEGEGEEPPDHEVEFTAVDVLRAAGQEGLLASLVVGATDMLDRFLEVDHDWLLQVVGASIPASEKIVAAADSGRLPFTLTPKKDGSRITSLVGMFNAYLRHIGCDGHIEVRWRVDAKSREPAQLVGFYPVIPGIDESPR